MSGAVYYGLRYYSPRIGRWLNQDPIGEQGGMNLYAFVRNNPTNLIDILGMSWHHVIIDEYDDCDDDLDYSKQDIPKNIFAGYNCRHVRVWDWVWYDDGDNSSYEDGVSGDDGNVVDKGSKNPPAPPAPIPQPLTKEQLAIKEATKRFCDLLTQQMDYLYNEYTKVSESVSGAMRSLSSAKSQLSKVETDYAITAGFDAVGFTPIPAIQTAGAIGGTAYVFQKDVTGDGADMDDKILNIINEGGHIGEAYAKKVRAPTATLNRMNTGNNLYGIFMAIYNFGKYFNQSINSRMDVMRKDIELDAAQKKADFLKKQWLETRQKYIDNCGGS